jgi:hypothetical protein
MTGHSFRVEVRKTDEPGNSTVGRVTWTANRYESRASRYKDIAEKADMREIVPNYWWAEFSFRDGEWVLVDLGSHSEAELPAFGDFSGKKLVFDEKYSTRKDEDDVTVDWWRAFQDNRS